MIILHFCETMLKKASFNEVKRLIYVQQEFVVQRVIMILYVTLGPEIRSLFCKGYEMILKTNSLNS